METNLTVDDATGSARLKLGGSLTIQDAAELKTVLVDAMDRGNAMQLDLADVSDFDLSAIQLLYACHLASVGSGRQFQLAEECPELFREAVEKAGFSWAEWLCFGNQEK